MSSPEAIAVVGIGCKFPGANSVEEFWRILDLGQSMLSEPLSRRFPTHDHQRNAEKTVYFGNYVDDIASFDHRFFKKSSREAASMDPQQRLLLEVSYQALESSGFFGPREPDLDIGCFIGVCASDYNDNVASHPSNAFSALGTLRAFVPGRVSHCFGLTGPSVAIDTACSSSAVAIDAACKAILHGDCKSAIAGGVSVFTSPYFFQNLSAASFLSPTGASKSFDARADGYCRGEGIGLVVLKRLSQAVADGDNIFGTILATSVRQSSNKVPITVPYSPSQTALYRKLLSTAGISAEHVTYVEAHGTGTPVGDPLEFEAIKEVFGSKPRDHTLYFASVKGNIGHTEGASGVAGLIKTLLMMQKRAIPRQANFTSVHPKITLIPERLCVPTVTVPWTADTLIACVNNYGAAGSIAAMVVKEAPANRSQSQAKTKILHSAETRGWRKYPVIITANSAKSLQENCAALQDYLSSFRLHHDLDLSLLKALAFNLSDKQNRTLPSMLATSVTSWSDLDEQLRLTTSNPELPLTQANAKPNPTILVFGGQTARFVGLNRSVYDSSALLRSFLDECDEVTKSFNGQGIYPNIFETKPIDDVVLLQLMQFALHYACAQSWIACGLTVDCVLGHSFGQLVAMTVAGVVSLVDGIKLVHGRAVLMRDKWGPEKGSMIAVEADYAEVVELISTVQKISTSSGFGLEIACFNGPKSHVLVGSSTEISSLVEVAKESRTIKFKVLDVTHGFHSRFCDPILRDLEKLARDITFNRPKINIETCSSDKTWPAFNAESVVDHTRTPVYFAEAAKRLEARYGTCTWLEAGSNTSVVSIVRRALSDQKSTSATHMFCPVNLGRDDALSAVADTTIDLWKHGHHVQFWLFHRMQSQDYEPLNLPPYQFEKTQHWLDFNLQAANAPGSTVAPREALERLLIEPEPEPEPVLITFSGFQDDGDRLQAGQRQAIFTIDPRSDEWKTLVDGHSVLNEHLCPAPLYIELVLQAAKQLAAIMNIPCTPFARVDDLEMPSPLGMSQNKTIQLILKPSDQSGYKFSFSFLAQERRIGSGKRERSQVDHLTTTHASGKVEIIPANDTSVNTEFERTRKLLQYIHLNQSKDRDLKYAEMITQPGGEAAHGTLIYKIFSRVVQYRDFYKGVRRIAGSSGGSVVAEVKLPEPQPGCTEQLLSTPVAIDNFFQVPGWYANCIAPCPPEEVFVSTHIDRVQLSPEFGKLQAQGKSRGWDVFAMSTDISDKESSNDIFVTDQVTGELVLVALGAKFSRVRTGSLAKILSRANVDNASSTGLSTAAQRGPLRTGTNLPVPTQTREPVPAKVPYDHPRDVFQQQTPTSKTVSIDQMQPLNSNHKDIRIQTNGIEDELRTMLSKMTDVPANQFKGHVTLAELGIDSLMATEIVSEVHEVFRISIPQDRLQDLQTFASLCEYLDNHETRQGTQRKSTAPQPQITMVAPPLPSQQRNGITLSSEIANDDSIVQISSEMDINKVQDSVSRLATLLGSYFNCPASDFQHSTNLADLGLDSLLCMELMSDVEGLFNVSIDQSVLTNVATFGLLADILASAIVPPGGPSSAVSSSTASSTRVRSSGMNTPITVPGSGIDDGQVLKQAMQAPSSPFLSVEVLASAAREFEGIKGDFDKFADKYKFSDFYGTAYEKQSQLVLAYVVEAFSDFGVDLGTLRPGEPVPQISVVPKHHRMLKVFREILRSGKLADYDGNGYVRSDEPVDATPSENLFKDIIENFPQHAKEHTLLNLCGANMSKILSGKMDPLTILFGNKKNRAILEDVYTTAPMFVIESQLLTSFLENSLSTSVPGPDGKFRIVELGAGTGATTRWVVERLVQQGIPIEYTFTDISPALVASAKPKFNGFECVKFATIDIEKEPSTQFLGQFDIVLATNCIHATRNLHNSLSNINKLLRPHGFVSLVELTTRNFWLDMVFGLLDGWWLYDDGRPYVLATPEFWDKTMRQTGFQHVSWTGGHTRESEVCRVITAFKEPVTDPTLYKSLPQEKAGGVETLVFAHTDKRLPLRADIYYPSPSQASSHRNWVAGLMIHGGGHVMLSRKDLRPRQLQLLLDNGVLPVAVDYRLCPETTILDGPIFDVGRAYSWLRNILPSLKLSQTNINELLDISRAVVVGWSTGGTLAMSLAWTSTQQGIPPPDAILAFYCPTDYEDEFWRKPNIPEHSDKFANEIYNVVDGVSPAPITSYNVPSKMMAAAGWIAPSDPRSRVVLHMNWHGQTLPILFRGLPSASSIVPQAAGHFNHLEQPQKENVVRASPYAQITRGNYKSPTYIVFGTSDDLIPWQQAQKTVKALKDAGIQSGLTLAPGQPHLFDMYRDSDGSRWRYVMEGYNFLFQMSGRDIA